MDPPKLHRALYFFLCVCWCRCGVLSVQLLLHHIHLRVQGVCECIYSKIYAYIYIDMHIYIHVILIFSCLGPGWMYQPGISS